MPLQATDTNSPGPADLRVAGRGQRPSCTQPDGGFAQAVAEGVELAPYNVLKIMAVRLLLAPHRST